MVAQLQIENIIPILKPYMAERFLVCLTLAGAQLVFVVDIDLWLSRRRVSSLQESPRI